jgi:hypothetical protein
VVAAAFTVLASLAPVHGGQARVSLQIGEVKQLGPAHPGQPVSLMVEVRNSGQAECGPCQIRVLGGGVATGQPLPRIAPGQSAKVTVGGLVFSEVGKYPLSIVVDAPKDSIEFTGRRPRATFELTVLKGVPIQRGSPR